MRDSEAPIVEVLEDQEAQHHGGRCPQPTASATLWVAARQGVGDAIDEFVIVEQRIDPAERGVPELVRIGAGALRPGCAACTAAAAWRLR